MSENGDRPPSRRGILGQLKRIFNEGRFMPASHIRSQQESRNIPHSALLAVFETARVIEDPYWDKDYNDWHVVIEGDALDEDGPVRVVLGVDLENEFLFLVTCY